MVITSEVHLPTEEELTVPEVNISSAALRAGAFHLGKDCLNENNVSLIHLQIHLCILHSVFSISVILHNFGV